MNKLFITWHWSHILLILALVLTGLALDQGGRVQATASSAVQAATLEAADFTCASVSEIPPAECEALVALYNSTNGDGWYYHTGWLFTNTPCSWRGISCWVPGHVTYIDLPSNQLSGSIPAELGNLTNLQWLDLYNNQLSGSIPPELGNLSNLQGLYLSSNQLSGSIPAELGNLSNLQGLYLSSNQLSGSIPAELGYLTNLQRLYLYQNQLSGSIPAELGNLSNLQGLYLQENQLSGRAPAELGSLTSLSSLMLHSNPLSGPLPFSLVNLSLHSFYFNNTNLCEPADPTFQAWLFSIENLVHTRICGSSQVSGTVTTWDGYPVDGVTIWAGSNISTTTTWYDNGQFLLTGLMTGTYTITPQRIGFALSFSPPSITLNVPPDRANVNFITYYESGSFSCAEVSQIPQSECEALVTLYNKTKGNGWRQSFNWLFSYSPCSWGGISCTAGHVTTLDLTSNNLIGTIPTQLGNLTYLENLDLAGNYLSGSIPSQLGHLSSLQELNISRNQLSGSIPPQLGNLSDLRELILYYNYLTGSIPVEMGNLSKLEYLDLAGNHISGSFPAELGNLTGLRTLDLQQNKLSGAIPPEFGNLNGLSVLNLSQNQLIGDIPLEITNLTNLGTDYSWEVDFGYNALTASDPEVVTFMNTKDPYWDLTQTVAPGELTATLEENSVLLTWTPINYTQDGGYYEISYARDIAGPFTVYGKTLNKSKDSYRLSNLTENETYYIRVRTFTPAHGYQQNNLWSEYTSITFVLGIDADFEATPTSGDAPLTVQFTNLSGGDFTTCSWSFGDGTESTTCSDPSHTYTAPGVYTVSLTVSGPDGTDTETKTAYITVVSPEPTGTKLYLPLTMR